MDMEYLGFILSICVGFLMLMASAGIVGLAVYIGVSVIQAYENRRSDRK